MKYEEAKKLSEKEFRRLTGIKRKTFNKMVKVLKKAEKIQKASGGRPNKLCIEDRLLMTLEYLREYRTYFHVAKNFGLSESAGYKNICWVENTLIKDDNFKLPGKKALKEEGNEIEIVLVDVTESPIERPKKNKKNITLARKNATL